MATAKETSSPLEHKQSNQSVTMAMSDEIDALVSQFKGQCKVMNTTGRFVKTVKLHPENLDIVFNFRLTESYPSTLPEIDVRSDSLDEDDTFDLKDYMTHSAETMATVSMVKLVDEALIWLREEHISVKGKQVQKKQNERNITKSRKKQAKKAKDVDRPDKGKKPAMKTSMDVVKRILWDPELQQDQFIVGYLDRIDGLKEKYFNAFSWEHIASVDYTVLAIPKHRIQFFKYKDEIVWDKRVRLDNVFGSTGSKKTIKDIVAKLDDEVSRRDNGDVDDEAADTSPRHQDSDYYDSEDITDTDSDDSDDGITVTIGNIDGDVDDDLDNVNENDDEDDHFNKYWRDKLRPNYFLALRITEDEIRSSIDKVQNYITDNEKMLGQCCIPKAALHITLCTIGLETPEQLQNAIDCLHDARPELAAIITKDTKLKFKGVDNFFNRVVYGKVQDCPPEFYELVEHLKLCLNERGIEIRDYHEFVPHMTIAKISRPVARVIGTKYIAPWLYSCFNNFEIGQQTVNNIHLCEMGDDRQEDGFYISAVSLDI